MMNERIRNELGKTLEEFDTNIPLAEAAIASAAAKCAHLSLTPFRPIADVLKEYTEAAPPLGGSTEILEKCNGGLANARITFINTIELLRSIITELIQTKPINSVRLKTANPEEEKKELFLHQIALLVKMRNALIDCGIGPGDKDVCGYMAPIMLNEHSTKKSNLFMREQEQTILDLIDYITTNLLTCALGSSSSSGAQASSSSSSVAQASSSSSSSNSSMTNNNNVTEENNLELSEETKEKDNEFATTLFSEDMLSFLNQLLDSIKKEEEIPNYAAYAASVVVQGTPRRDAFESTPMTPGPSLTFYSPTSSQRQQGSISASSPINENSEGDPLINSLTLLQNQGFIKFSEEEGTTNISITNITNNNYVLRTEQYSSSSISSSDKMKQQPFNKGDTITIDQNSIANISLSYPEFGGGRLKTKSRSTKRNGTRYHKPTKQNNPNKSTRTKVARLLSRKLKRSHLHRSHRGQRPKTQAAQRTTQRRRKSN
jgi:hypothetical protein